MSQQTSSQYQLIEFRNHTIVPYSHHIISDISKILVEGPERLTDKQSFLSFQLGRTHYCSDWFRRYPQTCPSVPLRNQYCVLAQPYFVTRLLSVT